MNVSITVLVENTAVGQGLLAEHGLACWIEYGSQCILFDTGQGMILANNAYRLKIPLYEADAIVLSHGHYDHTSLGNPETGPGPLHGQSGGGSVVERLS